MSTPLTIAAIDLGKSRCRVAVLRGSERSTLADAGSPGLATSDGVDTALAAILPLLERAGAVQAIAVGAAGAWSAPAAALELARSLARATGAAAAVASDVVIAHVGALQGRSGTLLIAGTGAAALGVDAQGVRLVDGWGPDLGDFGGGSWIGREGVRATLRARAGLAEQTVLTDLVRAHITPSSDPVAWLAGGTPVARQLATVAPLVLDAAENGDPAAEAIVRDAVRLLTASATAASAEAAVVIHGGLTDHAWFRGELETSLTASGRTLTLAAGDALDGAALLVRHRDMPHERFVHRA